MINVDPLEIMRYRITKLALCGQELSDRMKRFRQEPDKLQALKEMDILVEEIRELEEGL